MDTYEARLATFIDWPADSPVKKEDLARAGQFYTDDGDVTKCCVCNRRLSGWEKGDDPYDEHKKNYPECQLSKQPLGNIAIPTTSVRRTGDDLAGSSVSERFRELTIQSEGPFRELQTNSSSYRGRLESFQQGWQHQDNLLSQNISLAGFHYIGGDDRVKCSWCHLTMNRWQPMEVPYYEHKAAKPQCPFIQTTDSEIKAFPDKLPVRQIPYTEQEPTYRGRCYRITDASGQEKMWPPLRSDTPVCIKCKHNPRQILFEPCSHMVLCEICSVEYSRCPACGCPIVKKSWVRSSTNTSISTTPE